MEIKKGNVHGNLKCAGCGGYDIRMHVCYDGVDEHSKSGAGSGFVYGVDLVCEDCGRCYPVCRVKSEFAVDALAEHGKNFVRCSDD